MTAHPDRGGSNEAQQRVNIAYEVLSDPIQRRQHDIFWKVAQARKPAGDSQREKSQRSNSTYTGRSASSGSLSAFHVRLDAAIKTRKAQIWSELSSRTETRFNDFKLKYRAARKSAAISALVSVVGFFVAINLPVFWFAAVVPLFFLASNLSGVNLAGSKFGIFQKTSDETLRSLAHKVAAEACHNEASQFDNYSGYFASILELALRSSSFDDSEAQVARRIVVAFFFSGYLPELYDAQARILTFVDGEEKIAVRFRHRSGASVNVAYLKGLSERMGARGEYKGIVFCSPGLSGNAADYADRYGIRWYTLEAMNKWIDELLNEGASGPKGDILKNIDSLRSFLSRITESVGYSPRRRRRFR